MEMKLSHENHTQMTSWDAEKTEQNETSADKNC